MRDRMTHLPGELRTARRGRDRGAHRRDELFEVEWLFEDGHIESGELLAGRHEGSDGRRADDDRDPARRRVEGEDVELGPPAAVPVQEDIEDHEVRVAVPDVPERVRGCIDDEALGLERGGDGRPGVVIVLDEDDASALQRRIDAVGDAVWSS